MTVDLPSLLDPVREIAQEAAGEILEVYATDFRVARKADRSPVTEADMRAQACIERRLAELTPSIPVCSEESAAEWPFEAREGREWLWLVDPLDGTRHFVSGSDEFTVNIGLVHGHRPVLGVILAPVTGTCYYAHAGGGAFKRSPGGPPAGIRSSAPPHHPTRVAGSRNRSGPAMRAFLERLGAYRLTGLGSALKSCLVAEGVVDLYPRLGPTGEWDTAAAQVIVEEAGGRITDTRMQPLRYNARPTLINPDFFAFGDPRMDWSRYLPRAA